MKKQFNTVYPLAFLMFFAGTFLAGSAPATVPLSCSFYVAGYYPDYYFEQLPISEIRYDKLTDVIYFSIYPNPDGSLHAGEINLARQQQLVQMAHQNNTRVSICVGGWGLSGNFSSVAANSQTRAALIANLEQYCLTHDLDGIALDWEPVSTESDKLHYTSLIQELKLAMQPHALTLSVAVFAQGSEFLTAALSSIDRLHIMAYDMGRPHSTYEDALAALVHWENFGCSRSKMVLGLPFYGRDFDIHSWIYYPYQDIVREYAPSPDDDEAAGINFNGIHTIKYKTQYILQNRYGGVMIWDLTNDSTDATSLLTAVAETIHANQLPDFNCDRMINMTDFVYFVSQWLREGCREETHWCQRSDLDLSGKVDLSDMALFCEYWLTGD